MGGRGISWEVASVLVSGRNMQKVMRLYKRRYIICTSYTFTTDAIWYAIRLYIVTTHRFGILTSKLCILNVIMHSPAYCTLRTNINRFSTCFRPKLLPDAILERKNRLLILSSIVPSLVRCFNLESSWFCPPLQRPVKSDDQILQEELQKLEVQESEVKSADAWDKFVPS